MRRSIVVVLALCSIAFLLVGGPSLLFSPSTNELVPEQPDAEPELIHPTDGDSGFWPFLNSKQSFEGRSPINVVVVGDADSVLTLLTQARDADWAESDEEELEADPETHSLLNGTNDSVDEGISIGSTEITWSRTSGATRYAYVNPGDGSGGRWITETAQVHDGTYYGYRYHIRLYENPNPDDPWVALQTHSEHFDWFTLRHRVDGSQAAQVRVESDLMGLPGIDPRTDVSRIYLGNQNGSDADGWATFVDLLGTIAAGVLLGFSIGVNSLGQLRNRLRTRLSAADRRRLAVAADRIELEHLLLAGFIPALLLTVRFGGIALEQYTGISMHGIAALLYPFIAIGLPVGTYLIAAGLERRLDAAVVAGGAFAVGLWLDYGYLGIESLPVDVVVHRMLVVVAIGLFAAGAARRAARATRLNGLSVAGVVLWATFLAGTLFGLL